MSRDKFSEVSCRAKLEKKGIRFTDTKSFVVPKGRLGLGGLAMVDYLSNYCGMHPRFD